MINFPFPLPSLIEIKFGNFVVDAIGSPGHDLLRLEIAHVRLLSDKGEPIIDFNKPCAIRSRETLTIAIPKELAILGTKVQLPDATQP